MSHIEFEYPSGGSVVIGNHKYMTYKEYLKTPEWCPKKTRNIYS